MASTRALLSEYDLRCDPHDPQKLTDAEIERAAVYIERFADRPLPIVVDAQNQVLVGRVFYAAARKRAIKHLIVVRHHGLEETEVLMFSIAANKLLKFETWDGSTMDAALREFEANIPHFSRALIGFAPGELDRIVGLVGSSGDADKLPPVSLRAISRIGSLWLAGRH